MRAHLKYMERYPEVNAWLQNRPPGTQRKFADALRLFLNHIKLEPEEWRSLDKFQARDLAWAWVEPKIKHHSGVACASLTALKSFYRNKNGEQLPFDSSKGGKHYIHVRRKKAATEHIPSKEEFYAIVDMASNLRDKAMLHMLFQSGVRVNVIEHMTYGNVSDQLGQDTIRLKITEHLDHKLRGRDIPFYYTFLNGEAARTLTRYCEIRHKQSTPETPLFITSRGTPVGQVWVLKVVKTCIKKAGYNPRTMSTHSLRKAFRKIVRQANIDDDTKEQLMGHVLPGSRESYFDRNTPDLIHKAYQKCNFQRETPESEVSKLRKQLENSEMRQALDQDRLSRLERELETLKSLLKEKLE